MGFGGSGNWFVKDLPLFIAFAVLAAYTYSSGLRAPALIAFVKDTLIYVVIIVAVIYLPSQLGGWGHIFSATNDSFTQFNTDNADAIAAGQASPKGMIPPPTRSGPTRHWPSARPWRCSCTRTRSPACSPPATASVIRRNAALLPAYSFLLGLLALLGFVAIAAGVKVAATRPTRSSRCRSCSRTSSRPGSPASRSPPS